MENDEWDLIATPQQGPIKTHGVAQCAGQYCCVHNPSDHHMVTWPIIFDMKKWALAMRVCEHGYTHPDPDSLQYFARRQEIHESVIVMLALHTCDGCCSTPPAEE